ncbi:hypothetical protein UA32_16520 [Photobacterium angustum]|uniref:Uncharacterized protein n=1 Tax=Photobacterium angustum TaxID=661 RepID=A0ABX5H970_PHOAN|nr:hypothetical protein UA32_16520 [Photobacterium angustum]PSX12229.1 hypothetical protein C0W27_03265 [Photobacterium angustum]
MINILFIVFLNNIDIYFINKSINANVVNKILTINRVAIFCDALIMLNKIQIKKGANQLLFYNATNWN